MRAGRSILVFRVDAQPFESRPLRAEDGVVLGPALEHVLEFVRTVAVTTRTLCIRGETGSGKEIVARAFHAAAGRAGRPFVAVNCATIQPSLAERLLFGAKRGAFSGAGEDADGYAQAADRGTLFLDEIGELDAQVQAKLLRFLETGEILPVGDSRPRSVAVSLVCASHRDLAEEVRLGRFRSDLYFRVSQPFVVVPPLRERREEIPHYVVAHLAAAPDKPEPSAAFIEAVMLEAWPGNVRQLLRSLDAAVVHARVRSANILLPTDLQTSSPSILGVEPSGPPSPPRPATVDESPLDDDDVRRALAAESGNVSRAARLLGVHRNRVRRWLEKHGRAALPAGAQDPMEDTMESAAHPKSSA
ncbi:MAG: sigma 54-interacting transcriptional regulator [Polyangiaceae bacterium]